ncbi:MAG TPA: hypothetical protein VLF95_11950, partial [Vicinamibacteria bacterium]|nr:hypothetical protein [Vicinamibacteria bacterium]
MSGSGGRPHRAGEPIADLCRACKAVRSHTVMAVDAEGRAARVVCDFCGSQHNYRGADAGPSPAFSAPERPPAPAPAARLAGRHEGMVDVTEAETTKDLEWLFRRVLREELGLTP